MARASAQRPSVRTAEGLRVTTLASGARVVTESMPQVRSVAVGFWVNCGSRDERGPLAGASHFLEHLLFKGTQRRGAQEIAETVDAVGGDLNAFTSKEYTCFYARCLDRDLPLAVDVLADMITSSKVRSADVEAERDVVLEEIRMHLDTPDDLVHTVFSETYFDDHPLGRETLGSMETITAMRRDQVFGYYRRRYVPEHLVVAAAGNLDHDDLVDQVAHALGEWVPPQDAAGLRRGRPRAQNVSRTTVRPRPTEQAHIVLGGPGVDRSDDRRFAAGVLNQALGGGMASRLFQEVRERRGLVYTVYSYQGAHSDAGTFSVYAGTSPSKAGTVLEVVKAELDKARTDGLSDEELERAKGHLAGGMVLALEDTGSRMTRVGKAVTTDTPLLSLDETIAAVEAVDHDAVAQVAATMLGGPWTLALVGPFKAADEARFARYAAA